MPAWAAALLDAVGDASEHALLVIQRLADVPYIGRPCAALGGAGDSVFTDDAIRIEKYYEEYGSKSQLHYLDVRTAGTISVHINSNRNGNGRRFENWLDYAVGWCARRLSLRA